jgi:hypothetical protein
MKNSEKNEDQIEPKTKENPTQEKSFIASPNVEHAAVSRIAVPDPS